MRNTEGRMLSVQIAKNLIRLRRSFGLSQAEFSKKVNLSQSKISTLETGLKAPNLATILQIACELKVDVLTLMQDTKEMVRTKRRDTRVLVSVGQASVRIIRLKKEYQSVNIQVSELAYLKQLKGRAQMRAEYLNFGGLMSAGSSLEISGGGEVLIRMDPRDRMGRHVILLVCGPCGSKAEC